MIVVFAAVPAFVFKFRIFSFPFDAPALVFCWTPSFDCGIKLPFRGLGGIFSHMPMPVFSDAVPTAVYLLHCLVPGSRVRRYTAIVVVAFLFGAAPLPAPPFTVEGPGVDPADFHVTVYAAGMDFPLGMAELPDGSLLATVSEGTNFFDTTGKLVRYVDTTGDGVADASPQVMYEDLPGTQTAVRVGGTLVFVTGAAKPISILRLGQTPDAPFSFVGSIDFAYPDGDYHAHSALEIRPAPGEEDSWELFFQLGSDSNFAASTRTVPISSDTVAGVSGTLVSDSAYRITIADHGTHVSASNLTRIGAGLRNAAGFAFHPATGDLYFQDNGIDGLEDPNIPHSPDELNRIRREDIGREVFDFGFPDNYTVYRTGEIVGGDGVPPLMVFQPWPDPITGRRSEGANEITFAPPAFPTGLNRGLFIGFHGKFAFGGLQNDENPVVYADPETGEYFHFIAGQQPGLGHPIGLLATRDSLYVADLVTHGNLFNGAGAGAIYRIQSQVPPEPPDLRIRKTDDGVRVEWDCGTLETFDTPAGPWAPVPDAFSPLTVPPEDLPRFFRAGY